MSVMLKIKPPNYKFCPLCGTKLKITREEGKRRKYCPNCNWKYYPKVDVAAVAIPIIDNKVLLVKRARQPYNKTWMLPGGFTTYGEHPKDTVIREIKEETGLHVADLTLYDVIQFEDDPREPGHLIFFYKVEVKGKPENLDVDENSKVGWFDLDQLPKIGWKSHKLILKKLNAGKL